MVLPAAGQAVSSAVFGAACLKRSAACAAAFFQIFEYARCSALGATACSIRSNGQA